MRPKQHPAIGPALSILIAAALVLPSSLALAQNDPVDEAPAETRADDALLDESQLTRRERKQLAKEKRIAEYLRKREEKQARKEAAATARELESQQMAETQKEAEARSAAQAAQAAPAAQVAPAPAAATTRVTKTTTAPRKKAKTTKRSNLPRNLARAQANVRSTSLGQDPTVQEYLALIDEQLASPHQLAAFGNFLAQNGLLTDAMEYYNVALRIEQSDPVLWINVGTLHQQANNLDTAASAFSRALELAPNNAQAHYNLGSVYNAQNSYDEALKEYKTALFLEPSLGDPAFNPQAVNNHLLTAVKLMLYREQTGNLGMPLIDIPTEGSETGGTE